MLSDLEDIILFASLAHKNQKMVEPEVPYFTHVIGVASNVLEAYYNGKHPFDLDYALKLAILHDIIEDTEICYQNLENKYGERVAKGVLALTKNEEINKNFRIEEAISRIKLCDKEVAIVKLADRVFNMRSKPACWDKSQCERYYNDAKKIFYELGYANEYLKQKLKERIEWYNLNDKKKR